MDQILPKRAFFNSEGIVFMKLSNSIIPPDLSKTTCFTNVSGSSMTNHDIHDADEGLNMNAVSNQQSPLHFYA